MTFDGKAFGEEIISAVKAHVERKLAPIFERLERFDQNINRIDHRIDAIALRGVAASVDENAIIERAIQALVPAIDERVREAAAAIPVPTIDDVRPLIEAEVTRAVGRLKQAKPQIRSLKALTINRGGSLIATLEDGEFQNLGTVVEHHGAEFEDAITVGVRALPRPETYQPC